MYPYFFWKAERGWMVGKRGREHGAPRSPDGNPLDPEWFRRRRGCWCFNLVDVTMLSIDLPEKGGPPGKARGWDGADDADGGKRKSQCRAGECACS